MSTPSAKHVDRPVAPPVAEGRQRLWLLLLNFLPLVHLALLAYIGLAAPMGWLGCLLAVAAGLYLLPPLCHRLLCAIFRPGFGRIPCADTAFLHWWASAQLQMIFCRCPTLEEVLRLVPGLYSCWLRLWGARIGRLTYWAPGLRILDRAHLDIGDDVVFGASVRLNAHVIMTEAAGTPVLILAPIKVGHAASIGGYSLLTAGTEVAPGESLRAFQVSPPFSLWRDRRRIKRTPSEEQPSNESNQ